MDKEIDKQWKKCTGSSFRPKHNQEIIVSTELKKTEVKAKYNRNTDEVTSIQGITIRFATYLGYWRAI
jgi:hypothetical protein